MFHNILTSTGAAGRMSSILFLVIIFVVFYFFLIRPENKRKKKLNDMRNNISLGDEIVTIGGIMGKVVQVTFETGEDRVRLQVTKWAVSSNVREEKERAAQEAAARAAKAKGKKKAKTSGEENSVDGEGK